MCANDLICHVSLPCFVLLSECHYYFLSVGIEGCSPGTFTTSTSVNTIPKCNHAHTHTLNYAYLHHPSTIVFAQLIIFILNGEQVISALQGNFPATVELHVIALFVTTYANVICFRNENCQIGCLMVVLRYQLLARDIFCS